MASKLVHISAVWNKYQKCFDYCVTAYNPGDGYVLLEERKSFFESPAESELRIKAAVVLREKKNKVIADAHVEALEIEQEIQELLALEDKTTQKAEDDITF